MKRAAYYGGPAILFIASVTLIITQSLGVHAYLWERLTWLSAEAVTALALAWWMSAARAWQRLYRSLDKTYGMCEASRDYWMNAAMANAALARHEEPDP